LRFTSISASFPHPIFGREKSSSFFIVNCEGATEQDSVFVLFALLLFATRVIFGVVVLALLSFSSSMASAVFDLLVWTTLFSTIFCMT
jgi:hypothetical protein